MTSTLAHAPGATVLVVEHDVLIRTALAGYLRDCGYRVIEAAAGREAKTVLQHGPEIHVLLADARLAGDDEGFALAQWVRRYRPGVSVMLGASLQSKSNAAADLCGRSKTPPPTLRLPDRINAMRKRQARGPHSGFGPQTEARTGSG